MRHTFAVIPCLTLPADHDAVHDAVRDLQDLQVRWVHLINDGEPTGAADEHQLRRLVHGFGGRIGVSR